MVRMAINHTPARMRSMSETTLFHRPLNRFPVFSTRNPTLSAPPLRYIQYVNPADLTANLLSTEKQERMGSSSSGRTASRSEFNGLEAGVGEIRDAIFVSVGIMLISFIY